MRLHGDYGFSFLPLGYIRNNRESLMVHPVILVKVPRLKDKLSGFYRRMFERNSSQSLVLGWSFPYSASSEFEIQKVEQLFVENLKFKFKAKTRNESVRYEVKKIRVGWTGPYRPTINDSHVKINTDKWI